MLIVLFGISWHLSAKLIEIFVLFLVIFVQKINTKFSVYGILVILWVSSVKLGCVEITDT